MRHESCAKKANSVEDKLARPLPIARWYLTRVSSKRLMGSAVAGVPVVLVADVPPTERILRSEVISAGLVPMPAKEKLPG